MAYPIKINLKTEILPVTILISAFGLAGYFYNHFPERVAGHWNFAGQVDGYTSKAGAVWAIPIMLVVMYGLFNMLPLLDPNKERYQEFEKTFRIIRGGIMGVLFLVYVTTGIFNLGVDLPIGKIIGGTIGILMILLGNYLGKLKRNWFVGIKTPWTLGSENVWNKTHRVSGWLFIIFGLILIVAPFLPAGVAGWLFGMGVALVTVGSMGYSYILYREEIKQKTSKK